jgi:hypothetical protein
MPRVSIWFVCASLIALLLGATLGAVILGAKGVGAVGGARILLPAHIELVVIGWMLQLTMGVAQWILPRFGASGPARGNRAAWIAFGALNVGVLCVVATATASGGVGQAVRWGGRMAEVAAVGAFIASVWSRVRASGISAM